jgi:hypothetical protein
MPGRLSRATLYSMVQRGELPVSELARQSAYRCRHSSAGWPARSQPAEVRASPHLSLHRLVSPGPTMDRWIALLCVSPYGVRDRCCGPALLQRDPFQTYPVYGGQRSPNWTKGVMRGVSYAIFYQSTATSGALAHARRGQAVLTAYWTNRGRCACGRADCHSPAKCPIPELVPPKRDRTEYDRKLNCLWSTGGLLARRTTTACTDSRSASTCATACAASPARSTWTTSSRWHRCHPDSTIHQV